MFEEAAKNSTNYDDLFIKFDNKIRMDEDAEWIDRPAFYGINKDILLDDEDKNLSKDLYSTILDSQNNKKNSEDPKFQRIDCSKDESRPSLVNNLTIREIVKNLFTTSQMCDQIIETSPGPPDSNKCEFSSEFGQNLTVQAGVNSESFNLS